MEGHEKHETHKKVARVFVLFVLFVANKHPNRFTRSISPMLDAVPADWFPINSPIGMLATLSTVCALVYWIEKTTDWRFFQIVPSVAFIYLVPLVLSNTGILATKSPVFDAMDRIMLPMMLVLLLLNVNVRGTIRVMGRGVGVMLIGSLGVVVGALVSYLLVRNWLGPDAWKAYGALAGSWTGGTANLTAVSQMFDATGAETGLAVLGDATIYTAWLPVLLASKRFAEPFARFTRVEANRLARMDEEVAKQYRESRAPSSRDYLYLLSIALMVTWLADIAVLWLPSFDPYLTKSTWRILLITTIGIGLSYTALRNVPGSQELAMALVFLYLAKTGASAELKELADQAVPFLLGAVLWVAIHGAFCVLGAWLLRMDLHTAAIASAANIGGVAAASIVATHHRKSLVPAAILMALIGFAIGNYCGYITGVLCRLLS
jgi:uncharacterized membrane protein